MSHTSDQPEPHDHQRWRAFTDREAHQDRLTHELATAVNDDKDW